jgi:hypothetical protein
MKTRHLFFLLTLIPAFVSAQAWLKPKGKTFSQIQFTYLKYDRLINGNSLDNIRIPVTDNTISFY